jgi:hypothetical protein
MPKRKEPPPTPEDQVSNFEAEVRRLIDAGELSPIEADAAMERAMGGVRTPKE